MSEGTDETKYHVFYSYSHDDNNEISGELWFTKFRRTLESYLKAKRYRFWRDKGQLRGSGAIKPEIVDALQCTELLLPIVGAGYMSSPYCLEELEIFSQHVIACLGDEPQQLRRIVRVEKEPLPHDALPARIRQLPSHQFYYYQDGAPRLYRWWGEMPDEYFNLIQDVGEDIKACLELATGQEREARASAFVASVTSDAVPLRVLVQRELAAKEVAVAHPGALSAVMSASKYLEEVRRLARDCLFSVHIVGDRRGLVPEGSNRDIVELQWEALSELEASNPDFHRILWIPEAVKDPTVRRIVDQFQMADPERVTVVKQQRTRLLRAVTERAESVPSASSKRAVLKNALYCVSAEADRSFLVDVLCGTPGVAVSNSGKESIRDGPPDRRLLALLPDATTHARESGELHQINMRHCGGWLLFHRSAPKTWLEQQVSDYFKFRSRGHSSLPEVILCHPQRVEEALSLDLGLPVVDIGPDFGPRSLTEILFGRSTSTFVSEPPQNEERPGITSAGAEKCLPRRRINRVMTKRGKKYANMESPILFVVCLVLGLWIWFLVRYHFH